MSTFGKQIFKSEQRKWFQHQREMVKELFDKYSKANKNIKFSVGIYGNQAEIKIPFSSGSNLTYVKKVVEEIQNPGDIGSVANPLKTAFKDMFTPSFGSSKMSKKVLVLFVDKEIGVSEQDAIGHAKKLRDNGVKVVVILAGTVISDKTIAEIIGKNGQLLILRKPEESTIDVMAIVEDIFKKGL